PPFPLLPSLHHTLPTPFPYTTLFRSSVVQELGVRKKFTERDPVLVVPAPLLIRGATPLFSGEYVLDRREGIEEYPSFWREVCQRNCSFGSAVSPGYTSSRRRSALRLSLKSTMAASLVRGRGRPSVVRAEEQCSRPVPGSR